MPVPPLLSREQGQALSPMGAASLKTGSCAPGTPSGLGLQLGLVSSPPSRGLSPHRPQNALFVLSWVRETRCLRYGC